MELEIAIGGVEVEVKVEGLRGAATLFGLSALTSAVVKELRMRPAERRWHGTLLGVVPYDLRPPSPARLRAALWDPSSPDLLRPTAFGVGWTVNAAAVAGRCGCLPAGAGDARAATEPVPQASS